MKKDLVKIEFYFPEKKDIKNKRELADLILDMMRKRGSTAYAGHRNEKDIYEGIMQYVGDADISQYKPLSESRRKEIQKKIEKTIKRCAKILSIPTKNYVFVFPYLPTEKDKIFEGIMGVARYSCVFHIFLSPNFWSHHALANTIAHELNHTIFYYHHYNNFNNYILLDEMILEGLAENFREQVIDKMPTPWSVALTQKKAFNALESMNKLLPSKDNNIHRNILFGNKKYKRWTGYSMGYWLVNVILAKEFYIELFQFLFLIKKRIIITTKEFVKNALASLLEQFMFSFWN